MTEILTGYNVTNVPNSKVIKNQLYLTNDYDAVKVWDGLSGSMNDAGIISPAAAIGTPTTGSSGAVTDGDHLVRYRYKNSQSPTGEYRSNPSTSITHTVASNQEFYFTVGASATDIIHSTDPKVDTIVLEMTEAAGTTYYIVSEIANDSTANLTVTISDTTLIAGTATSTYEDFGHEPPPSALTLAECRGFAFYGGAADIDIGSVTTDGTTTVTGTGFPDAIDERFIRFDSESEVYTISSVDSTTSLTLDRAYTGANGSHTTNVVSKTPSRIYWSRTGDPEAFKVLERARDMLQGKNDSLIGMADYIGDLWCFGRHSMERLVFVSDPALGERIDVAGSYGLWNQRCMIQLEGQMFGWGTNGAWVISGARPRWLSERIDVTVNGDIDYSYSDKFHGEHDPDTKTIRWYYVASGDTQCKKSIVYDLERDQFSIDTYRKEINGATIGPDSDNNIHNYVCDDDFSWEHTGATDGVPNTTDRQVTVDNGSTTTSTVITTGLTSSSSDWAGVTLYNATQDITTVITGLNSSTDIATESWTTPVFGDILYVGSIPMKIKTPWLITNSEQKMKPDYLHITFSPDTAGTIRVRYYTEFSTTAEGTAAGVDYDPPDGVSIPVDSDYMDVDIDGGSGDGFVAVPCIHEWDRSIQAEVECFDSRGTLRILDVKFEQPRVMSVEDGE